MVVEGLQYVVFVFAKNSNGVRVIENCAMIEQLMSRSLPSDHQGHAAGLVGLHVGSPFPVTPSSTITAMFSFLPWRLYPCDGQEINGRRRWAS